ncbi:hypothetical protein ACGRHY_28100 [Streptomyces sp. HK10]|uniref:hypothetical protein n=1 Tax=Streptomyces sp. HK10 TaxID=3373255 RepID=UPI003748BA2C
MITVEQFAETAAQAGYVPAACGHRAPGHHQFELRPYREPDPETGVIRTAEITQRLHARPERTDERIPIREAIDTCAWPGPSGAAADGLYARKVPLQNRSSPARAR